MAMTTKRLNPIPQLFLVLQLPARGRKCTKNNRPPSCLQIQYRTYSSIKSMILLSRPKPTLTFLKQYLDQTISGKSLHNGSTTDLKDKFFSWALIHRYLCSLPTWICSSRLRWPSPPSLYTWHCLASYLPTHLLPMLNPLGHQPLQFKIQGSFSSMPSRAVLFKIRTLRKSSSLCGAYMAV